MSFSLHLFVEIDLQNVIHVILSQLHFSLVVCIANGRFIIDLRVDIHKILLANFLCENFHLKTPLDERLKASITADRSLKAGSVSSKVKLALQDFYRAVRKILTLI